ncbi:MAG: amidohydrolase family protein [Alphaproteobacteria bacterium]|nr:amidohydrolase family protein [Alphaproteobacteria bacterium]
MTDNPILPIKIDATSNGEYAPLPVGRHIRAAQREAATDITGHARRTGQNRRVFLGTLAGAATSLLALNRAFAARGETAGFYHVPADAALDQQVAQATLGGDEFIFDVQCHMVDPGGPWRRNAGRGFIGALRSFPQGSCGEADAADCYSADMFIKEVFMDSDTDLAVMSFVPSPPETNPLSLQEAARAARLVEQLDGGHRLLLHAMVMPNLPNLHRQLDRMAEAVADYDIAAWKVYTQWGPNGVGWWLDDPDVGIPFIEQARRLGVRTIAIHKGLSFGGQQAQFASCVDVGRAAKLFPDVNFLIYHSGFEARRREGPYDAANAAAGVDSLVKSLHDNGIAPNSNVYAELGSTWRILMRDPSMGAHVLGKLFTHVGQQNVLWGTDSIWYGSPQDQITAFRAFRIAEPLQEKYGYPAMTPDLRRAVFGLNGARVYGLDPAAVRRKASLDPVGRAKAAYANAPTPSFATYGPQTIQEFRDLEALHGGWPG